MQVWIKYDHTWYIGLQTCMQVWIKYDFIWLWNVAHPHYAYAWEYISWRFLPVNLVGLGLSPSRSYMTSSYSIIGVIYHDDVINELLDNCQTSSYSIIGVASYGDIIIEFLGWLCCYLSLYCMINIRLSALFTMMT